MQQENTNPNNHQLNSRKQNSLQRYGNYLQEQEKFNYQKYYTNQYINNQLKSQLNTPYIVPQGKNISIRVRNRRYKKLLQLRNKGFFDQQAIKLRHPLLYYLFVGQYQYKQSSNKNNQQSISSNITKENSTNKENSLFSDFLGQHLINVEYRQLLNKQMPQQLQKILEIEKNINEQQIKKIKRMFNKNKKQVQTDILEQIDQQNQIYQKDILKNNNREQKMRNKDQIQQEMDIEEKSSKYDKIIQMSQRLRQYEPNEVQIQSIKHNSNNQINSNNIFMINNNKQNSMNQPQKVYQLYKRIQQKQQLNQQERDIQQQNLIQYCEQLFLQGKLVNVQQINYKQIDNNSDYDDIDEQNKDLQQSYFNQVNQQIQQGYQNYYTGIQDY